MSVKRFKLYHCPWTRSTRVKWVLHELLGEDFDVQRVDLYGGEGYSPDFLDKNPNHNVPVLEMLMDDGTTTTMLESGAMVAMLADAYPDKGLAPPAGEATAERALYVQMLHFATTWVDMMLWQIRCQTHLLHEDERDPLTLERYRKKFVNEVEPQLHKQLSRGDYIAGDQFTAADCAMGHTVVWAQAYGLGRDEILTNYIARLANRPAYQMAFADSADFPVVPPSPLPFRGFPG